MAVSPENKDARHLLHEYKKQQREEKINRLLGLADEAKKNKNTIDDHHLAWLDQILSTKTTTKPERLVESVLVMGKSKEALKEKKEPERIIEDMEPHAKVLQSLPEAQELWQQAQDLLQAVKYQEAKDILQEAADFFKRGDLQQARACMEQIKGGLLQEKDKKLFDTINLRLPYLEKFVRLKQNYTDAHDRGDHFTAKKIAGELAEHIKSAKKIVGPSTQIMSAICQNCELIMKNKSVLLFPFMSPFSF